MENPNAKLNQESPSFIRLPYFIGYAPSLGEEPPFKSALAIPFCIVEVGEETKFCCIQSSLASRWKPPGDRAEKVDFTRYLWALQRVETSSTRVFFVLDVRF